MLPLVRLCLDLGGVDTGVQEVCCFVRAWARGGRLLVDSGMAGFTVWMLWGFRCILPCSEMWPTECCS